MVVAWFETTLLFGFSMVSCLCFLLFLLDASIQLMLLLASHLSSTCSLFITFAKFESFIELILQVLWSRSFRAGSCCVPFMIVVFSLLLTFLRMLFQVASEFLYALKNEPSHQRL